MHRKPIPSGRALALVLLLMPLVLSAACTDSTSTSPSLLPGAPFSTTDLVVGTGADATAGRAVSIFYTGWIYDPTKTDSKGTQFDTNVGGTPFSFQLGVGSVIPGFDRGVAGMKQGGRRRIVIPPDLAYGSQGNGGAIPPNATLVFDVELVTVQ